MMHHTQTMPRISSDMNRETEICDKMLRSVICRVEKYEVSRSHKRSIAYSVISFGAILGLIPIVLFIVESSYSSGFGQYLSLFVSDSSYMIQNWREFMLSAVSSLPIMGAISVLLILFILTNALRRTVSHSEYADSIRQRLSIIN
jgi:hypothetical protein